VQSLTQVDVSASGVSGATQSKLLQLLASDMLQFFHISAALRHLVPDDDLVKGVSNLPLVLNLILVSAVHSCL
jgi:hypothetical protein